METTAALCVGEWHCRTFKRTWWCLKADEEHWKLPSHRSASVCGSTGHLLHPLTPQGSAAPFQVLRCQRKSTFWGNSIWGGERLTLVKIALGRSDPLGEPGWKSRLVCDPQDHGLRCTRPGVRKSEGPRAGLQGLLTFSEIEQQQQQHNFRPL